MSSYLNLEQFTMKTAKAKPIVLCACFTATFLLGASKAAAALVVTMVGTVEEGSLNNTDLAGSLFTYSAIITNPTDIDDVYPDTGTFVVDHAQLDFGVNRVYDFGPQPGYFNWGTTTSQNFPNAFYAYFVLTVDVPNSVYADGFGFSGVNTSLSGFDPNVLSKFGPFNEFDQSWTFNTTPGSFLTSNGLGDTLVLSRLGTSGVLAVTAVPEPSSGALVLSMLRAGLMRRRRSTGVRD
jgi:hypothetical protein